MRRDALLRFLAEVSDELPGLIAHRRRFFGDLPRGAPLGAFVQERGGPLGIVIELDAQLAHRLLRIGGGLPQQFALLAALRNPDRHVAAAALGQPLLDQLAVGQGGGMVKSIIIKKSQGWDI